MSEPKTHIVDTEAPATPFEVEMIEAGKHAFQHIIEGYIQAMDCGLAATLAKSQGVLWACQQVLTHHLMQHMASQLHSPDKVVYEIENITRNIKSMFDDNYPQHLAEAIAFRAEESTKH